MSTGSWPDRQRLLISCPDQPGIVAAVSRFITERDGNIVHSDQHSTAPSDGLFVMRVVFDLSGSSGGGETFRTQFGAVAGPFEMEWRLIPAARRKRLAIFVSRESHCLLELLWQRQAGDLTAEISMIVSNHSELETVAREWHIPFHHLPVDRGTREEVETREQALLDGQADLLVLARYMQILSPRFVRRWPNAIINIHHSFLPAFAGARPYDQAYERGVKLIGATAHYVTDELDAGPIIEQGVERVDHRHTLEDLRRIGRINERHVLARAVRWHVEDRIIVQGNKTVVFS